MNENFKKGVDILREEFENFGINPTEDMLENALHGAIPVNVVSNEHINWLAKTIRDSNRALARNCFLIGLGTGLIWTLYIAYDWNKNVKSKTE